MAVLTPKDWADFQHYTKRTPPWIKLHRTLLDNYEFHCLHDASKALAPLLWLLASEHDGGHIPWNPERIAFRLRLTPSQFHAAISPLLSGGFFTLSGDGADDASTALATCKQDAIPETEGETEGEGERQRARMADPYAWVTPFAVEWDRAIGIANKPKLALSLRPLVEQHGAPQVYAAWQGYMREGTGQKWVSPGHFVQTYKAVAARWALAANADGALVPIPDMPDHLTLEVA